MRYRTLHLLTLILLIGWPPIVSAQSGDVASNGHRRWHVSRQCLGLTYHPGGATTPEAYPLKVDHRAFLVLDVGAAANLDCSVGDHAFLRFTTTLYKDCASVTAGCLHAGPRLGYSWGRNSLNVGIGPILSLREDWHRFPEYQDDEFYGDRVYRGWQYRLFGSAAEVEYLRRVGGDTELQCSLIPGVSLVVTLMVALRWAL